MTSREFVKLLFRRWYAVLLGVAVALAISWPMTHRPGVYATQFDVVLLPPVYEYFPNKYEDPQYALAPLASVLVADWNGAHPPLLTASSTTTLYGEGVRDGVMVRMANHGNQWTPLFPLPNIDVQVVKSDPAEVSATAREVVHELQSMLQRRQDELHVVPAYRATLVASSGDANISYVAGSRVRSFGALAVIGLITTMAGVHLAERLQRDRRGARANEVAKVRLRTNRQDSDRPAVLIADR